MFDITNLIYDTRNMNSWYQKILCIIWYQKNGISDFLRAEIRFFWYQKMILWYQKNNLRFQKISLTIIATNVNECSPAFCAKTFTVVMWALGASEYISNLGIYYSNLIDMSVLKPNEIWHEIKNDYNTFTPTPLPLFC